MKKVLSHKPDSICTTFGTRGRNSGQTRNSGTDGTFSEICLTRLVWLIMIGHFRERETSRLPPPPTNLTVGVGIMIAHNPLHGSGQAALPHPALALGEDGHEMEGIGMTDDRRRQQASDEAPHAIPKDAAVLAAPRQRAMPEPPHLEAEKPQRRCVHGHSVIPDVSTHHRLQPLALFRDGFVHTSLKFGFHLIQLRLQPFAYRLPQHREPSITPFLYADVRKAKKVERLRLPFSTPLSVVGRERTKLQQARFLAMQFH